MRGVLLSLLVVSPAFAGGLFHDLIGDGPELTVSVSRRVIRPAATVSYGSVGSAIRYQSYGSAGSSSGYASRGSASGYASAGSSSGYQAVKTPVVQRTVERTAQRVRRGYPLRNRRHWTVAGLSSPSRAYLIRHLTSGHHAGKFSVSWLNSLSMAELRNLHDDDHERSVRWGNVVRRGATVERTVQRAYTPSFTPAVVPTVQRTVQRSRQSTNNCPGGVCPRAIMPRRFKGLGIFRR